MRKRWIDPKNRCVLILMSADRGKVKGHLNDTIGPFETQMQAWNFARQHGLVKRCSVHLLSNPSDYERMEPENSGGGEAA
jgi:hypothetical protein